MTRRGYRAVSQGGSPGLMLSTRTPQISPSCSTCAGVSASKTACLTDSTWAGATLTSLAYPSSVSVASVTRRSSGEVCLRIQPRFSSRVAACDNRDNDPLLSSARELIWMVRSGASERAARVEYSKKLSPLHCRASSRRLGKTSVTKARLRQEVSSAGESQRGSVMAQTITSST